MYDVGTDTWSSIGKLMYGRYLHTVLEVPGEFCDNFKPYVPQTTTEDPNNTEDPNKDDGASAVVISTVVIVSAALFSLLL